MVAGFGTGVEQTIWLFSVPPDIFAVSQDTQAGSSRSASVFKKTSSRSGSRDNWLYWWPDENLQHWLDHTHDPVPGILPRSVWPVRIKGQLIGCCAGLVDLAIDSGPHMTIWAFSKTGIAAVWKLDDGHYESVKRHNIVRDGTIREGQEDGDIEMFDSPSDPRTLETPLPAYAESFDGAGSISDISRSSQPTHYDADGDVLMADLPGSSVGRETGQGDLEAVLMDSQEHAVHYQTETWSQSTYRVNLVDFVEELTGIARIDVEVC